MAALIVPNIAGFQPIKLWIAYMQYLDLNTDDPAQASGKHLNINGVDYLLLDLLASGSKYFVFPVRNVRSGMTSFVAKIFKFPPNSPEFAKILETMWKPLFAMECQGIPVLHTEFYKIPGGLISLQRLLATVKDPAYNEHDDLMRAAANAGEAGRYNEAIAHYHEVLRRNPGHVYAMTYLAGLIIGTGDFGQAITLLEKAKSIDPNVREIYHQLAAVLASLGRPAMALSVIDQTLKRWKYDFESIKRQITIAIDYDYVDVAERRLSEVQAWTNQLGQLETFKTELTKSQARRADSSRLSGLGIKAQEAKDWKTAREHYSAASRITKDNATHQLNEFVCRYHLWENVNWKEVAPLAYLLPPFAYQGSLLLTALFCARTSDLAQTGRLLELLDQIEEPLDLPGVPQGFVPVDGNMCGVLEDRSARPVIDLLQDLLDSGTLLDRSVNPITSLLKKYKEREATAAKSANPP